MPEEKVVKKQKQKRSSYRAGTLGKIITERNRVRKLFKYLQKNPNDQQAYDAYVNVGGNVNKLNLKISAAKKVTSVDHLAEKVKYAKMQPGEGGHYLGDKHTSLRDFQATYLTADQLKAGIVRARSRQHTCGTTDRVAMYVDQITAYRARLIFYEKG